MVRIILVLLILATVQFTNAQHPKSPLLNSFNQYLYKKESSPYKLEWIPLGPTINSARVDAVQVDTKNPGTMYVSFGAGNMWKTTNNGLTWKAIFENQPSLAIGDIAIAPSNSSVIYIGTGVSLKKPRNFTMPGTGVYRSDDAGETWKHLGLDDSWHIGEIVVHPTNADIVYVAVLGHFWSTNHNRGVYRTLNGGINWEHVLYVDDRTGANDIVISPTDPNRLYASMWENNPGVNGTNSNVYRSSDGGKTWSKADNGFPIDEGKGRIGLAVSQTNPDKVYAFMDHRGKDEGKGAAEIYRSIDGGLTWKKTHEDELHFLSVIGWYFADIYVAPDDDDEIFALGVRLAHSTDGGKTFSYIGGDVFHLFPSIPDPLHLDQCELWINPQNPNHLALGNDGGFYVSYDKGLTWMHYNNIPAGEFYDITLDKKNPYTIYGGAQDNATVYGHAKEWNPKFFDEWKYLWVDPWSGGDGCITLIDSEDSTTLYYSSQEGGIRRCNLQTGISINVRPTVAKDHPQLKYNFISPYNLSPHDHNTLYLGGNYVMKSENRGDNWKVISGDLSISKNENKKGFAISALAESSLEKDLIYVGTDKGAFWVTKDGGKNWEERSEKLPNNYIRCITPSRYKASRVYITLSGLNYDDLNVYVYKSEDYGKTWEPIMAELPNEVAYVIKEDPVHESILYLGLFRGVYISTTGGKSWSMLGRGMPAASVSDIEIDEKSGDLVASTYGRGIYKVNLRPVQEAHTSKVTDAYLFKLPEAKALLFDFDKGGFDYRKLEKLPITFWVNTKSEAKLCVLNSANQEVWSTSINTTKGFNQYRWDLVVKKNESNLPYFTKYNEFIQPGEYTLQVIIGSKILTDKLIIRGAK